jgi:hypothetical protein
VKSELDLSIFDFRFCLFLLLFLAFLFSKYVVLHNSTNSALELERRFFTMSCRAEPVSLL